MVDKADQCVVMSTGYGKSLCYQFQTEYEDMVVIVAWCLPSWRTRCWASNHQGYPQLSLAQPRTTQRRC